MRPSQCVNCKDFPCVDVNSDRYTVPDVKVDADEVRIVLISEATPQSEGDYYYAKGRPLFEETTVQAFQDAGVGVSSIRELLAMGVYLTTAIKCGKTGYGIKATTIRACSKILADELALLPNVKALLLMGDVAIKAMNYIAKAAGEPRVVPVGSTYKIRGGTYAFRGVRAFPSYLQAGKAFFIEKSKRQMIAEDIAAAVEVARR